MRYADGQDLWALASRFLKVNSYEAVQAQSDGSWRESENHLSCKDGERPEDAGVSEAEPRGGVFQSDVRGFGGIGHCSRLHASASGAREKERAYLLLAGEPS